MDKPVTLVVLIILYIVFTLFGMGYWFTYKRFIKTAKETYGDLLENKNWFGKIYTYMFILLTIPSLILAMIIYLVVCLFYLVHDLGIKKEVD